MSEAEGIPDLNRTWPSGPTSQQRTLALTQEVEDWPLTTLREKVVKIGAKVVRHGRYVTLSIGRGGSAP